MFYFFTFKFHLRNSRFSPSVFASHNICSPSIFTSGFPDFSPSHFASDLVSHLHPQGRLPRTLIRPCGQARPPGKHWKSLGLGLPSPPQPRQQPGSAAAQLAHGARWTAVAVQLASGASATATMAIKVWQASAADKSWQARVAGTSSSNHRGPPYAFT